MNILHCNYIQYRKKYIYIYIYIFITKLITDNYCSTHSECLKGIFIKAYEIFSDIMHPKTLTS